jgi:hypothetical protein
MNPEAFGSRVVYIKDAGFCLTEEQVDKAYAELHPSTTPAFVGGEIVEWRDGKHPGKFVVIGKGNVQTLCEREYYGPVFFGDVRVFDGRRTWTTKISNLTKVGSL